MKTTVLIPVKSLTTGKSRLSKKLTGSQREQLILLLFRHVVTTLKKTKNELLIFVVSNDPTIIATAKTLHINHIYEKQPGHNTALTNAATEINPTYPLLTISADLPFITEEDVTKLISLLGKTDAVVVASKEKTGTNALLLKKPLLIPYLFGKNSFSKFIAALDKKNLTHKTFYTDTLAFDIDTVEDLKKFKSQLKKEGSVLHKFYKNVV